VGTRNAELVCDCHDSLFQLQDGAVISGPATSALPEIAITVKDGKIFTA
jgi:nitrite reductase/ring-hydroxylating ferredoxin subunit